MIRHQRPQERADSSLRRGDQHAAKSGGLGSAIVARALGTECVGTFALTLVAAGGEVVSVMSGGVVDHAVWALAPGLMVLAMIYALGQVSGAHINPAVTSAFALRGVFPWRRAPGYWLPQAIGALVAAMLLRQFFGDVARLGSNQPRGGVATSFVMESVLTLLPTLLPVTVILGTATRARLLGPDAAKAAGATVALPGLFAAPISGASMNPTRSLAPAVVAGTLADPWLYRVDPIGRSAQQVP